MSLFLPVLLGDNNEHDEEKDAQNSKNRHKSERKSGLWTTENERGNRKHHCFVISRSHFTSHSFVASYQVPEADLTFAGDLSHLYEDGITKFSKLGESLHPAADVYFIIFPYVQPVDCLLSVWL